LSVTVQFKAGNFLATFTIKIRHPPMPKFYNPGPRKGKTYLYYMKSFQLNHVLIFSFPQNTM